MSHLLYTVVSMFCFPQALEKGLRLLQHQERSLFDGMEMSPKCSFDVHKQRNKREISRTRSCVFVFRASPSICADCLSRLFTVEFQLCNVIMKNNHEKLLMLTK